MLVHPARTEYLKLDSRLQGRPTLMLPYRCRCSSPVSSPHSTSNWGHTPITALRGRGGGWQGGSLHGARNASKLCLQSSHLWHSTLSLAPTVHPSCPPDAVHATGGGQALSVHQRVAAAGGQHTWLAGGWSNAGV